MTLPFENEMLNDQEILDILMIFMMDFDDIPELIEPEEE